MINSEKMSDVNNSVPANIISSSTSVPLTIVTGFLGAGKTTLVNRFLKYFVDQKQKVAIIQNEFSG